jgi:hypothetical protein
MKVAWTTSRGHQYFHIKPEKKGKKREKNVEKKEVCNSCIVLVCRIYSGYGAIWSGAI